MVPLRDRLLGGYRALLAAYGPQGWWPGEGPFEVLVGTVLTQGTAWRNVEQALAQLKAAGVLSPAGLRGLPQADLERLLRPAGTYRVKAGRLRALLHYLDAAHGGDPRALAHAEPAGLRAALLAVPGVGPETADCILLYVAGRATFVVDAYVRRLLHRLGWLGAAELGAGRTPLNVAYEALRGFLLAGLPADPALLGEYHALVVRHGKERCRKRGPRCPGCPLLEACRHGGGEAGPEAGLVGLGSRAGS